jgi:regulatory protein
VTEDRDGLALALRALGRKEHSVAELGSWLRARGVPEAEAELLIGHLVETEVLDDARFAHRYAEDKREISGWGSERIRAALIDRGVSAADAAAAVGSEDAEMELERAVALLRDRGLTLEGEQERGRALGLLARRGYESDVAYEAIRRVRTDLP